MRQLFLDLTVFSPMREAANFLEERTMLLALSDNLKHLWPSDMQIFYWTIIPLSLARDFLEPSIKSLVGVTS